MLKIRKSFLRKSIINFFSHENNQKISQKFKASDFLGIRHIGINCNDEKTMLQELGYPTIEKMMTQVIPDQIIDKEALNFNGLTLDSPLSENQYLQELKQTMSKNQIKKCFIGQGYYGTITPPVILRHIIENPDWYTSYTPYQPECSQGRLESLFNFQTVITELTGLDYSNASLLDEATSASEALYLSFLYHEQQRKKFFIQNTSFTNVIESVQTKAKFLNIEVVIGDIKDFDFQNANQYCGAYFQSPDIYGIIHEYQDKIQKLNEQDVLTILGTDLLSLVLFKDAYEQQFQICVGNSQRFGVPMGYGGPAAAFFCVTDKLKRKIPGRLVGKSKDSQGNDCFRLTMQTREQHIKRDKATSNICTAQALLANCTSMYSVYHGPSGLKNIAERCYQFADIFSQFLEKIGLKVMQGIKFDTVTVQNIDVQKINQICLDNNQNICIHNDCVSISFDETTRIEDIQDLMKSFCLYSGKQLDLISLFENYQIKDIDQNLKRKRQFMNQKVFNQYQSETSLMRYMYKLVRKDVSLTRSMISLGSCTMKLNAASELMPLSWPEVNSLHPYVPMNQAQGYVELISQLEKWLKVCTKFDAFSFQSNSGAQGEYNGLLTIRQYQIDNNQGHRNICLIPLSAHGTNPASAQIAGLKVITIKNDKQGNIDLEDLLQKCNQHKDNLSCFMVTYPSTFGVFEIKVKEAIDMIHQYGGQVYMDGANMNAQTGWTSPGFLGADVCHLNLHKTFAIPHGGGGPGMGPIGVKAHLAPYLPNNRKSFGRLSSTNFGSASILTISHAYIRQLGYKYVKKSTAIAILNANYLMKKLESHYKIAFLGQNNLVAHEFIIDLRGFKATAGITEEDVAKRLLDYGFHAPTMSWPVQGTLMIEPTESEDKDELDRFIDSLIQIRKEIQMIIDGKYDKKDNPLKNAPHTQEIMTKEVWDHKYTRLEAWAPLPWIQNNKFWPSVSRVDNVYGDKTLFCCYPHIDEQN